MEGTFRKDCVIRLFRTSDLIQFSLPVGAHRERRAAYFELQRTWRIPRAASEGGIRKAECGMKMASELGWGSSGRGHTGHLVRGKSCEGQRKKPAARTECGSRRRLFLVRAFRAPALLDTWKLTRLHSIRVASKSQGGKLKFFLGWRMRDTGGDGALETG
jgi:hypothetical protein